jgi:hypothetical protein
VIGELHETPRGWVLEGPAECANGHRLGLGRYLVSRQPCSCAGGHLMWTCRQCEDTTYWPPVDPTCSLLHGGAHVRVL